MFGLNRTKKSRNKGFTLLELLVVIGIIAILMGFGTVSFRSAQQRARDARRKGDLKAMQNALEQYYVEHNYTYPNSCSDAVIYLSNSIWPSDPIGDATYNYTNRCTLVDYRITATLEADGSNFQVINLQ